MTTDLSQFFQTFFEESAEHLADMEQILLGIDIETPDEDALHAVFRAAHSIKGGAATFGFDDMALATHTLESLLDRVRHHELRLTSQMCELFLESKDVIGMLLAGHRDGAEVDHTQLRQVSERLAELHGSSTTAPAPASSADKIAEQPSLQQATQQRYEITFVPAVDLFRNGGRVEPLFDELATIGELTVEASLKQPVILEAFDPETCLLEWHLTLHSTASVDDIRDIFMFVADDDQLVITVHAPEIQQDTANQSNNTSAAPSENESSLNMGRRAYDRNESAPGAFGRRPGDTTEAASIRVGVSKVDMLINQMGELVITQAMLAQCAEQLDPIQFENLHRGLALLERNTRNLQESVMSIRMMPISFIFSRFPRLVHDLANKLNKQVELKLIGETTELDKGLIEKLADPLTHLVRNSLDHGIESSEERVHVGKPACGSITMRAGQVGGRVLVEVSDDGAGLNRARIMNKAAENGLPVSDTMTDEEVWQLIFAPGFSTAEQVTDVSGRGVGMDVVMKNVQAMGGRVSIQSTEGQGSRVLISLPLTMAILDGLSVRVGQEVFIVPLNEIIESLQPVQEDLNSVGGTHTTLHVRGEYLPLVPLYDLFGISNAKTEPTTGVIMLLEAEGERVALLVDELVSQHQVVIKSLETNYRRVAGTAGATILGDGTVALSLDTTALVQIWRGSKGRIGYE